jgi:hypothetical protein
LAKIREHIPGFADMGQEPLCFDFETTDELLEVPIVKRWNKPMGNHQFSHYTLHKNALMAVHDDGFHWWVVGFIDDLSAVDLPEWSGGKYRVVDESGELKILQSKDVSSVCGEYLTSYDGTVFKLKS